MEVNMDKKDFKKILGNVFESNSFIKKGKLFYKESEEIICHIDPQSNYCKGYYINIGFTIKALIQNDNKPDMYNSHIILRFVFDLNNKQIDLFELDCINNRELINTLNNNA